MTGLKLVPGVRGHTDLSEVALNGPAYRVGQSTDTLRAMCLVCWNRVQLTPLGRGEETWWALKLGVKGCVRLPPVDERGKGTQAEGTECAQDRGQEKAWHVWGATLSRAVI